MNAKQLLPALMLAALTTNATLPQKVDRYLAPLVDDHEFSGVVLVARGEHPIVARAYGKANWELSTPMTIDARFRIASITKTFTGAAIAMLAERGKLSLTDPLSKYLPDFPNAEKIQIRHLGLHQSGVPNPTSEQCSEATLDTLIAELAKQPLWFAPGTASGYSNGGFAVLARVIEITSGKAWEDFLREEIFKPAGLSGTGRDVAEPVMPMRVAAYAPGPGPAGLINAPCASAQATFGSGALVSTAGDLHRWARAVRNETLFKRSGLEHPYGWGVRKYFDRRAIEQSGINNGAASYMAAYLDDDVYVIVLSNVQSSALEDIGKGVAALTFDKEPPRLTPAPHAMASTATQRAAWIGRFRGPSFGFALEERNGALYQKWGNSRYGNYLIMTGPDEAFNIVDGAPLQLARDALGQVTAIRITLRGSSGATEFRKE